MEINTVSPRDPWILNLQICLLAKSYLSPWNQLSSVLLKPFKDTYTAGLTFVFLDVYCPRWGKTRWHSPFLFQLWDCKHASFSQPVYCHFFLLFLCFQLVICLKCHLMRKCCLVLQSTRRLNVALQRKICLRYLPPGISYNAVGHQFNVNESIIFIK